MGYIYIFYIHTYLHHIFAESPVSYITLFILKVTSQQFSFISSAICRWHLISLSSRDSKRIWWTMTSLLSIHRMGIVCYIKCDHESFLWDIFLICWGWSDYSLQLAALRRFIDAISSQFKVGKDNRHSLSNSMSKRCSISFRK